MTGYQSNEALPPVSALALAHFENVRPEIEEEVALLCLAQDTPQKTMGEDAATMIRTGLGFVSKMLRAAMRFEAAQILHDELSWGKTRLPVYGVSTKMILANFERYTLALERRLPPETFAEIKPYLDELLRRQRVLSAAPD